MLRLGNVTMDFPVERSIVSLVRRKIIGPKTARKRSLAFSSPSSKGF